MNFFLIFLTCFSYISLLASGTHLFSNLVKYQDLYKENPNAVISQAIACVPDYTEISFDRSQQQFTVQRGTDIERIKLITGYKAILQKIKQTNIIENEKINSAEEIVYNNKQITTDQETLSITSEKAIKHQDEYKMLLLSAGKEVQLNAPIVQLYNCMFNKNTIVNIRNTQVPDQSIIFSFNDDRCNALNMNLDLTQKDPQGTITVLGKAVMTFVTKK